MCLCKDHEGIRRKIADEIRKGIKPGAIPRVIRQAVDCHFFYNRSTLEKCADEWRMSPGMSPDEVRKIWEYNLEKFSTKYYLGLSDGDNFEIIPNDEWFKWAERDRQRVRDGEPPQNLVYDDEAIKRERDRRAARQVRATNPIAPPTRASGPGPETPPRTGVEAAPRKRQEDTMANIPPHNGGEEPMTEKKPVLPLEFLKGIKVTPRLETVSGNQMPGAFWLSIDIGLWRRRPRPHLTAVVYYTKGREWTPPAGQLAAWEEVLTKIRELWQRYACPKCKGGGGDCPECRNTGRVRFLEWTEKGRKLTPDNYPAL